MNKKWLGSFLLLITAIVWGFCFVVQRSCLDYVGAFTYGAARFLLGGLALIPLALLRPCEKQKRLFHPLLAGWTIRSQQELDSARAKGYDYPIFELFEPEK